MKILCISPHVPWPLHGGPQLRIYHTLRVLHELGYDVTLLAGTPDDRAIPDAVHRITAHARFFRTLTGHRTTRVARSLLSPAPYPAETFATRDYERVLKDALHDSWDLILVNHLIMLRPLTNAHVSDAVLLLDQHESDVEIWEGYQGSGNLTERLFARWNLAKVRRARTNAWDSLDGVICVAQEEMDELKAEIPSNVETFLAPNGVDTQAFSPNGAKRISERDPEIIFCAGMSVQRNAAAAIWFVEEAFPIVRSKVEDATVSIVGANPTRRVRELAASPGVRVTGTVPEVQPYYNRARVAIIPNRFGGFSKLKLSEALAMGIPIVATSSGGKGAPAGAHVIRHADNAIGFATQIVNLLEDDALAEKLAREGRRIAEEQLSWDQIIGELEQGLRGRLMEQPRADRGD